MSHVTTQHFISGLGLTLYREKQLSLVLCVDSTSFLEALLQGLISCQGSFCHFVAVELSAAAANLTFLFFSYTKVFCLFEFVENSLKDLLIFNIYFVTQQYRD